MALRFADFEIDVAQQELRRGGETVHMEPQVFDLLLHLVRNRGRIVSKDELIEAVWNGRIVSEAALSSRINAARKAIGDSGNDQILIKTFHKRGFRFVGEAIERPEDSVRPRAAGGGRGWARARRGAWRRTGPRPAPTPPRQGRRSRSCRSTISVAAPRATISATG